MLRRRLLLRPRRFVQQVFVGPVAACWSDWIDKVPHSQREFDSDTLQVINPQHTRRYEMGPMGKVRM